MDFGDAVIDAARGWICRNIDTADRRADYFGRATISENGIGIPIGPTANAINDFGRYLYGCPASGGPYPPLADAQFTGGQCVGDRYRITASFTNNFPGGVTNEVIDAVGGELFVGPISSVEVQGANPDVVVVHNNGEVSDFQSGNPSNQTPTNIRDVSVENVDNPGDMCGNLPNPGGENSSNNQPITYDGPDGNPITEPVDVTIGNPIILPNGNAVLPVTVTGPGWEVNVNIPTDGGEPTASPSGSQPGAEGCCPSPAPVVEPPPSDEDPPDEDPNGPIMGVIVTTTSGTGDSCVTEQGLGDGPTLNIPRLGTVHFGISAGGVAAWMNVIDIKNKRCFIPVPNGLTAISAKVNPVKGVTFDVKVVYQRQPVE